MFIILKLIKPFLLPPAALLIGMAVLLYLMIRRKWKWAQGILVVMLAGYYLLSTGPVAYLLVRSLERTVPLIVTSGSPEDSGTITGTMEEELEAIVVLAGGARNKGPYHQRAELSGPSWNRFWHGIELYRKYEGKIPILYAGGSGTPFDPAPIETALVRKYALSMGIPSADFWTETASRNTYENVREVKRILDRRFPGNDPHRVLLVTSSIHMPRAALVMIGTGIEPVPAPADFLVAKMPLDPLSFIPSAQTFAISTRCLHEWLGIIAYFIMGRL